MFLAVTRISNKKQKDRTSNNNRQQLQEKMVNIHKLSQTNWYLFWGLWLENQILGYQGAPVSIRHLVGHRSPCGLEPEDRETYGVVRSVVWNRVQGHGEGEKSDMRHDHETLGL